MMTDMANLLGQTLGGYQLIEVVGVGAMATVYKAFQPTLERWVAVKVLHYRRENTMRRFEREAKAIAMLRHRNILIVYEYGEDREWPFIVMEYVSGGALSDYLARQSIGWAQTVNLVIPVAEALHYAHGRNIIHRDVKPSNILLPQPDWPLLADFGLVKLPVNPDDTSVPVTRSGASMGTPAYVAPEQARGASVDHRSDIYSLGIVLFEMVTGRLPFDYSNPNKTLLAHLSEPVPLVGALNPNCPPALEKIIYKALEKSVERRYADMGELIADLRSIAPRPETEVVVAPQVDPAFGDNDSLKTVDFHLPPVTIPLPVDQMAAVPPTRQHARLLVTAKNVFINLPDREVMIIGRTHRDQSADIDLSPHGAAEVGISRHHAKIIRHDNNWLIDDMNSLNGTFVNEVRVKSGNPIPLKNGDLIRCSHLSLVFLISS